MLIDGKLWMALFRRAFQNNDYQDVQLLVEEEIGKDDGFLALRWAAWNGYLTIVILLLEKGADANSGSLPMDYLLPDDTGVSYHAPPDSVGEDAVEVHEVYWAVDMKSGTAEIIE
jgi:ankyrin repeat protein